MGAVRIGIIGLGMIAEQAHLPGMAASSNAEIHAMCDRNAVRLREMGDRYAIPPERRFSDYSEMMKLPGIEAVDIATPNFAHYEPMIEACAKGKHVCIEKPLAMNYRQAVEMESAAKRAGITAMVCFSFRFNPAIRFARWIIGEGHIGETLNVYIQYFKASTFIENRGLEWRFQKELAGSGVLGDLGSHMIDLTRFLAGEIKAVCSRKATAINERRRLDSDEIAQVTTDDCCDTIASLENGALANIAVSRCAIGNENAVRIAVYGTRGMIRFDAEKPDEIEVCSGRLDFLTNSAHSVKVPKTFYVEQMDCFAKSVRGDVDIYLPTLEDGLRCQKALDAMIASAEGERWIEI